jgi:catechol 2,3-dioxygenase-like lactoylglutathione lyase family enzyme
MTKQYNAGFICLAALAVSLSAGDAAAQPVAARATKYDNVHLRVADPAKATEWYVTHLGATAEGGRATLGGIVLAFVRTAKPQPSAGSVIDHIAVSLPDRAARMKQLAAAGVKIMPDGFIEDPWGTRIELLQDPQNLGFHHVHLAVSDPAGTVAWFRQMIGGEPVPNGAGLRYGSVALLVEKSAAPPAASADRAIMNVAFRVSEIHKAIAELKGKGVKVVTEPTAIGDLWYAFVESPAGVRVELLQRPQ